MHKFITRVGVAGVGAALASMVGALPAVAASTGRSDSCPQWACGSTTITFQDAYSANPVNLSIRDTACNGAVAYVKIHYYYVGGGSGYTSPRSASTVCGAGYSSFSSTLRLTSGKLAGVRVQVGDSINGNVDGNYVDNPYS